MSVRRLSHFTVHLTLKSSLFDWCEHSVPDPGMRTRVRLNVVHMYSSTKTKTQKWTAIM